MLMDDDIDDRNVTPASEFEPTPVQGKTPHHAMGQTAGGASVYNTPNAGAFTP